MRKKIALIFIFTLSLAHSQVPDGYYDSATGVNYELKSQLYEIINNHSDQGYNSLDDFYTNYDFDNYYENDNTILDIYSENPVGPDPYNFTAENSCGNYSSEGDCYNKEHIIPQSVYGSNYPMRSDAHQVLPTDGRVNGFRSAYPYGVVGANLISQNGISNPTQNGSKLGNNLNESFSSGYSGVVFEPIDEFKGDVARIYFYFITRYENLISSWSSYDMFDGSSDKVLEDTFLNILMNWHLNDPVSQKEIDRNNQIYIYQGNRNPFVDQPGYIEEIWSSTNDNESPTTPSNIQLFDVTSNTLQVSWNSSIDNISVASYNIYVDDNLHGNTQNTNYLIGGLSTTTYYCVSIAAIDQSNNSSTLSEEECATTLEQSTSTNELFISEYIEGSSNNKAIEIANFTGQVINLDSYTIARNTNSGTVWGEALQLTGEIVDGGVHVIARGNADDEITNNSNQLSSSDAISFNGDDPVGLFKDNTLIDVFGFFNGDNNYANSTYIRYENILNPNVSFNIEEWILYPNNTFEYLGYHNQNLSFEENIFIDLKIYPNPIIDNVLFIKSESDYFYEIFDIKGIRLLNGYNSEKVRVLDNLNFNPGIYFIKISSDKFFFTKKLIFN
jgi:endonuclease I